MSPLHAPATVPPLTFPLLLRALRRGLGVTLLEIMPYAALQFGLYDVFNKACNKARVREARAVRTGAAAPAA